MDNLPTNNQKTDEENKLPPTPPVSSDQTPPSTPPVTPPEPSPQVIPEAPEEKPPETPLKTPPEPEPTKSSEQPIEIGSLGQPSLSTLQDVGGKSSNKSKKIKSVVSVLGILLIIASLPLTVLLVKQRQEIRKEAASTEKRGPLSFCGITITPGDHYLQGGTYTFNYSITGSGKTVEVHEYGCACAEGDRESCGT